MADGKLDWAKTARSKLIDREPGLNAAGGFCSVRAFPPADLGYLRPPENTYSVPQRVGTGVAGMSEIMRFRMARAPQRAVIAESDELELWAAAIISDWVNSGNESDLAELFLQDQGMFPRQGSRLPAAHAFRSNEAAIAPALSAIRKLDRMLLSNAHEIGWDKVEPEFKKFFDGNATEVVKRPSWVRLCKLLSLSLVALVIRQGGAAIATDVIRLLLIAGLVRQGKPHPMHCANIAEAVEVCLRTNNKSEV